MSAFATPFLSALIRTSWQGALLIAAVWLVCRLVPRLPASLRCGLWWLACAKLVVGLVWAEPVRLALLPAAAEPPALLTAGSAGVSPVQSPLVAFSAPVHSIQPFPWQAVLLAVWAAGVLVLLSVTVWQHRRARRLVRRSEAVAEPWLAVLFSDLRERLRVPARTTVRLSPDARTPQVLGLVRPVVLLPASAPARLSRPEVAMTLCHELLHVRRGDLWLAWLPALAQRLFFFHPLALLAVREYVLAREAACDAEVLRVLDPVPETYGRLLLRLGVTPGALHLAAAGAAPSFHILKRRLLMLQNASDKKRFHPAWWALVALAAAVALIPFTITAQEPPASPSAAAAIPVPTVEPGTPAEPVQPVEPLAGLPVARIAQREAHAIPPIPPVPPVPPVRTSSGFWFGAHGDDSYVLLLHGKNTVMSGSTRDIARARKLRKSDDEELFWFERDDKEYVIRDAATLAQIKALFAPQEEMGKRQGALGEQQAKLGEQQAALGSKQAEQGVKQAGIGAQMGHLGAELARLSLEGKSTDAVEAQMRDLEEKQEEASRPQEDLSRQQEALGRQQEVLGRQQEELGRLQEKLAQEAEGKLAALTANAVSNGIAQEVK